MEGRETLLVLNPQLNASHSWLSADGEDQEKAGEMEEDIEAVTGAVVNRPDVGTLPRGSWHCPLGFWGVVCFTSPVFALSTGSQPATDPKLGKGWGGFPSDRIWTSLSSFNYCS